MNADNRLLLAHLARAVATYIPQADAEARQAGYRVPAELLLVAEWLADLATVRQDVTRVGDRGAAGDAGRMTSSALLMTKREVAVELRTSVRSVERRIAAGDLVAVKLEGSTRVRRSDLEAYVAGLSPTASFRDSVNLKDTA